MQLCCLRSGEDTREDLGKLLGESRFLILLCSISSVKILPSEYAVDRSEYCRMTLYFLFDYTDRIPAVLGFEGQGPVLDAITLVHGPSILTLRIPRDRNSSIGPRAPSC